MRRTGGRINRSRGESKALEFEEDCLRIRVYLLQLLRSNCSSKSNQTQIITVNLADQIRSSRSKSNRRRVEDGEGRSQQRSKTMRWRRSKVEDDELASKTNRRQSKKIEEKTNRRGRGRGRSAGDNPLIVEVDRL